MARTLRNAKLDSRSARARLTERREPYWTVISRGCALGYRKGLTGGTWIARLRRPDDGRQVYHAIGAADDHRDSDGLSVLSFAQAQEEARAWFPAKIREITGQDLPADDTYTVSDAVRDYLAAYKRRGGKSLDRMRAVVNAHVLPQLGSVPLSKLTRRRLESWLDQLAAVPPRLRSKKADGPRYRTIDPNDMETVRQRRSTANRVLTVLKAALNHAFDDGSARAANPQAWRSVSRFREADAARLRYLSDEEARRLVNASPPDLRALVMAALLTGARYGELVSLRVSDFDRTAGTISIRVSKSGKPRHVVLTDEGTEFFMKCSIGKSADKLLLVRADGRAWGRSDQHRPIGRACMAARIDPAVSFHCLRHSYATRLVQRGVPLLVVAAQLGHTDTRMVEKHYGHLSANYVATTVRNAFGDLGLGTSTGSLIPMTARKGRVG